jgi:hypothetical protein
MPKRGGAGPRRPAESAGEVGGTPGDTVRNLYPAVGLARFAFLHRYRMQKYCQSNTQSNTNYLNTEFGSPAAYAPGSPPAMKGGLTTPPSSHRNWTSKGGHVSLSETNKAMAETSKLVGAVKTLLPLIAGFFLG